MGQTTVGLYTKENLLPSILSSFLWLNDQISNTKHGWTQIHRNMHLRLE